ncbi:MAG: four helix bundle protein [Flavobacteriaceae bacterium]
MHNFKELNVWKESKDLCVLVYKLTKIFPTSEKYGIISQINRSSVSIPSNIAEGAGRNSNNDFARFIHIATGSSFELETQLMIAFEIGYIDNENFEKVINQLNKIQKMLVSFNKHLKQN